MISSLLKMVGMNALENAAKQREQGNDAKRFSEQNRQEGITYSSAPNLDTNTNVVGSAPLGLASVTMKESGGGNIPMAGDAASKEIQAFTPIESARGGYTLGPSIVDSSQSSAPYENSAIARYLRNYGGYRL